MTDKSIMDLADEYCKQYDYCSECPINIGPEGCPVMALRKLHVDELLYAIETLKEWNESREND